MHSITGRPLGPEQLARQASRPAPGVKLPALSPQPTQLSSRLQYVRFRSIWYRSSHHPSDSAGSSQRLDDANFLLIPLHIWKVHSSLLHQASTLLSQVMITHISSANVFVQRIRACLTSQDGGIDGGQPAQPQNLNPDSLMR